MKCYGAGSRFKRHRLERDSNPQPTEKKAKLEPLRYVATCPTLNKYRI